MNKSPLTFVLLSTAFVVVAQNSAPSSHFVFDDRFDGDIVINEVRVPKSGEAMYTYYEALGWRGRLRGDSGAPEGTYLHFFHLGSQGTHHPDSSRAPGRGNADGKIRRRRYRSKVLEL